MNDFLETIFMIAMAFVVCICLAFIVYISIVCFCGYLYDCIVGNALLRIGHHVGKYFPKLKKMALIKKMWGRVQPKSTYLRYETPLFTYCCSYTMLSLIAMLLPGRNGIQFVGASMIYLLCYFVGMARKCGDREEYYNKVLENNMDFLKLSFLPLGFLITVIGFWFTITGTKVEDIPFDYDAFGNWYTEFVTINTSADVFHQMGKLLGMIGILLVLFYITSLPIQVLAFFIISVIQYFKVYKTSYINILGKYLKIIKHIYFRKSD